MKRFIRMISSYFVWYITVKQFLLLHFICFDRLTKSHHLAEGYVMKTVESYRNIMGNHITFTEEYEDRNYL